MKVESVRRLPAGWGAIRVRDLADSIQYGHTASAVHRAEGPRFLRITDIQDGEVKWNSVPSCDVSSDDLNKYRLSQGDIVFARTGATTGKSYLIGESPEAVFASYLIRVRASKAVAPRYLAAFFQSPAYWAQIERGKRGIGQPNVNGQVLGEVVVPVAPRREQLRLVNEIDKYLSRLGVGAVALHRAQANLKRYRAAVLGAACEGRLVPTEAQLARRGRLCYESGDELLQRILAEQKARWNGRRAYKAPTGPDVSLQSQLPEGWVWVSVGQLGEVQLGRRRSPKNISRDFPTKYRWAANITERGIDLTDVLDMEFSPAERGRYALQEGDVILSEASGSPTQVGKPAVWHGELPLCCFQNTVIRLRPILISSPFILTVFRHFYFNGIFARTAGGVGINHLSADKFSSMAFPLPPLAEQQRVVAEVDRLFSVIDELEGVLDANIRRASRLRESILDRAFSGRLSGAREAASAPSGTVSPQRRHFARAVLSAEIVTRLHGEATFGRIKHQKIFHLCEHIARLQEIEGQYHREAAGPLDNRLLYANEAELKRQHWFRTVQRDGHGHSYEKMAKAGGHLKYVDRYWPTQLALIERLIELMRTWKTDRCEIFSTVYAAWNDLILWHRPVTDDAIVHEILNRWHSAKRQIPETRWRKAIQWVRENGFEPTGFGRPTASPE